MDRSEFIERVQKVQAMDRQHHLHPFTDPGSLQDAPPFVIDSASGCYISGQGIRLLDGLAGLGCVNVGYGRRELAEAAGQAMIDLSYYQSFASTTNPFAATLAAKLAALTPKHLNKFFFANSGSEANETLIKLIYLYWNRKGQPDKRGIITRRQSYHGSTIATTALTGMSRMHEDFGIKSAAVRYAAEPNWYRGGGDMTPDEFGIEAARSVERRIQEMGPENVGAIFLEPVQATGGAVIAPKTYWPEIRRIQREYDVLVVADEVVTGLGRTGKWFGHEKVGFRPDMMTLAKGLSSGYFPISAAVISDQVARVIEKKRAVLQHGFTTSAHPAGCAVALANIKILEDENLVEKIDQDLGRYFSTKMVKLENNPLVGEVRSMGLIAGIELTADKETRKQYPLEGNVCEHVAQGALARGVVVRATGNSIVVCPPFIIKPSEIDYIVQALDEAMTATYQALKQLAESE